MTRPPGGIEGGGLRRVAVFCGSRHGTEDAYVRASRGLGELMVRRGLGLVYGGGDVGLMGVIADAVLDNGGEVIGVIPESLRAREVAHEGLTELHVVDSMHERKRLMYSLADAMIALPGGIGTFDEFFEALTWNQLGIHRKPCGLLNVEGYYDPLVAMVRRAGDKRFVPAPEELIAVAGEAAELLDELGRRAASD